MQHLHFYSAQRDSHSPLCRRRYPSKDSIAVLASDSPSPNRNSGRESSNTRLDLDSRSSRLSTGVPRASVVCLCLESPWCRWAWSRASQALHVHLLSAPLANSGCLLKLTAATTKWIQDGSVRPRSSCLVLPRPPYSRGFSPLGTPFSESRHTVYCPSTHMNICKQQRQSNTPSPTARDA